MSDIIIFEAAAQQVEVRLEGESVWLTQKQMAELFEKDIRTINEHVGNVFEEGELDREATIRKFRIVRQEGKRQVHREIEHYNLDVIISIGYRVKSQRGVRFRQWATRILRDHLTRGYSINEHRLAQQGLSELEQTVDLLGKTLTRQELVTDIGREVIGLILGYAKTWRLLLDYDEGKLGVPAGAQPARGVLRLEEAGCLGRGIASARRGWRPVCTRPGRGAGSDPRQYRADHVWRPALQNPRGPRRAFAVFRDQEPPVLGWQQTLRSLSVFAVFTSGGHAPDPG